jgi:hypothetical protein
MYKLASAAAANCLAGRHRIHRRQIRSSVGPQGLPGWFDKNLQPNLHLLLLLLLLLQTVLQADIASSGDKYAAVQGLKAYLADSTIPKCHLLLLLLHTLLQNVLQADIASTGDKYAAVQGLKAYLADLAECLEFKAPLVEEMQDSLQQAREETAAALRQQAQVGLAVTHGLLLRSSLLSYLFRVMSRLLPLLLLVRGGAGQPAACKRPPQQQQCLASRSRWGFDCAFIIWVVQFFPGHCCSAALPVCLCLLGLSLWYLADDVAECLEFQGAAC